MKKTILFFIIAMLVFLPAFSIPAIAEPNTKVITAVYGGFPFPGSGPVPNFIHYNVSIGIWNIGKNPAYNLTCTLTIMGGFKNEINNTISFNQSELLPKKWTSFFINAYGFGPVQITMTVSASNINSINRTIKGFQIKGFTWIPLSWMIPVILQNLIPWLN